MRFGINETRAARTRDRGALIDHVRDVTIANRGKRHFTAFDSPLSSSQATYLAFRGTQMSP